MLSACVAPAASATVHSVQRGESLWSIAAATGLSPAALAAANGLSPRASLIAGSLIHIPASDPGAVATPAALSGRAAPGGYVVRPGDTLSAIAARDGVPVGELASINGLSVSGRLLAGAALRLPGGGGSGSVFAGPPYPTPVRVTSRAVSTTANQSGVPPAIASAIAWQESGLNNSLVSPVGATGVMQIMPRTWSWIQGHLAAAPLDPSSASDNVKAGVLYLRRLLRDTGGSAPLAVAAYYQGLSSVRRIGMLPDTRRYVADVLSLESRFGG